MNNLQTLFYGSILGVFANGFMAYNTIVSLNTSNAVVFIYIVSLILFVLSVLVSLLTGGMLVFEILIKKNK